MKYFSLNYKLLKKDYENYYKDFRKFNIIAMIKKGIFPLILSLLFAFFIFSGERAFYIPFLALLVISTFFSFLYQKRLSMSVMSSRQAQKETRVDFYGDHIEIHIPETQQSKATSEKHFKLKNFTMIAESEKNFYFSYLNEKMLIIPKRALNEETYEKIKNLINNYFSDRFNIL